MEAETETEAKVATRKQSSRDTNRVIATSVVMVILFLAVAFLATWLAREYSHYMQCATDPNIRCFDDWQCPGSGPTGYASSLFGPTSYPATACLMSGNNVCEGGGTGTCENSSVPYGCNCSFSGASSACLSVLCNPAWYLGAPGSGCPSLNS